MTGNNKQTGKKSAGKNTEKKAINGKVVNGKKVINGKTKINGANEGKIIPGPVFVTNGSFEGEVYLQWDAIPEANHYAVEISPNRAGKEGGSWQQVDIISDPHYSLQKLKSGKNYSFRISAIYSAGQSLWSDAVTKKIK